MWGLSWFKTSSVQPRASGMAGMVFVITWGLLLVFFCFGWGFFVFVDPAEPDSWGKFLHEV